MNANVGRAARALLVTLGGRVALFAVALLALGWFATAPLSVQRHATEAPFRVDYLAFDTAASILREGDLERLYDPDHQHQVQQRRAENDEPSYLVYLNPPIVGALYLPLAFLNARAGYVLVALVLTLTMVGVAALLYPALDGWSKRARLLACLCLLGSTATASAVISGQLTPFLLAIGAGALLAYRAGRAGLAGGALGLLAIKPHFALGVFAVLLLARQWRLAASMAAVAGVATLASFSLVGIEGAERYLSLLQRSFSRPASLYINVPTEQNLPGLLASLFHLYGGPWPRTGGFVVLAMGLFLVGRALANTRPMGADGPYYMAALAAAFVVATAPHVQFYDLGLLAFPAWFILRRAAAAPDDARPRLLGLLVVLIVWIETAGMLSGAGLSVSFPALAGLLLVLCAWPTVESWLVATGAEPLPVRAAARAA